MELAFPAVPDPAQMPCAPTVVEIALAGDVMVHGQQLYAARLAPRDDDGELQMDGLFDDVAPWLAEAHLAAVNLETNVWEDDPEGYSGFPAFNSPPAILEELRDAGVDLLQTANNHSMDRGDAGNTATLDAIESFGFAHTGTFRTFEERRDRPFARVTLPGGLDVAVIAYTFALEEGHAFVPWWRVNIVDADAMVADVTAARAAGADLIIVGLHWGYQEYVHTVEPDQGAVARRLVEAGADVVWGHHPHVLRPAEVISVPDGAGTRDGLVMYSLGNFVSNQRKPNRDGGAIARLTVLHCGTTDRTWLADVRFTPVWVDDRDETRKPSFRVVPALEGGESCGGRVTDDDCADLLRFRAHAIDMFGVENVDDALGPPLWTRVYMPGLLGDPTHPDATVFPWWPRSPGWR